MREIKFRGRVKKDNLPQYKKGQIVYGYPVKGENTYIHTQEEFYSAVVSMGWNMSTSVVLVEDEIEQYTGLKDKNDKEIYEGDKIADDDPCCDDFSIVIFKEGCFYLENYIVCERGEIMLHSENCFSDFDMHEDTFDVEIIGNIHDL